MGWLSPPPFYPFKGPFWGASLAIQECQIYDFIKQVTAISGFLFQAHSSLKIELQQSFCSSLDFSLFYYLLCVSFAPVIFFPLKIVFFYFSESPSLIFSVLTCLTGELKVGQFFVFFLLNVLFLHCHLIIIQKNLTLSDLLPLLPVLS